MLIIGIIGLLLCLSIIVMVLIKVIPKKKVVKEHKEKSNFIKEFKQVDSWMLEDFKDPDIPKKSITVPIEPKEETPEDYFNNLVFKDGKWQKP